MISLSIGLLNYLTVIDSGHKHKYLQYFLHYLQNYVALVLYDLSHILIELSLIPIALDYVILVYKRIHIRYDSPTKFIIILFIPMIMILQLMNKPLHFPIANNEK